MSKAVRSRIGAYLGVLVILGLVVAAAAFQEPLAAFFTLKLWDKGAPGRTVTEFLTAVKAGDKAKADSLLGDKMFQPLEENGKWIGYFLVSNAGTLDFKASDLIGEIKVSEPEFSTIGPGHALVSAPDAKGKQTVYRLDVREGAWKITEIRGGVPRAGSGMPAPSAAKKPAPKAPGGAAPTAPKGQ